MLICGVLLPALVLAIDAARESVDDSDYDVDCRHQEDAACLILPYCRLSPAGCVNGNVVSPYSVLETWPADPVDPADEEMDASNGTSSGAVTAVTLGVCTELADGVWAVVPGPCRYDAFAVDFFSDDGCQEFRATRKYAPNVAVELPLEMPGVDAAGVYVPQLQVFRCIDDVEPVHCGSYNRWACAEHEQDGYRCHWNSTSRACELSDKLPSAHPDQIDPEEEWVAPGVVNVTSLKARNAVRVRQVRALRASKVSAVADFRLATAKAAFAWGKVGVVVAVLALGAAVAAVAALVIPRSGASQSAVKFQVDVGDTSSDEPLIHPMPERNAAYV